jgi:hypothetical protein
MIKQLLVKKITVFASALTFTIIVVSCNGAKDDKNEVEHYPGSDTTKVEHKNDALHDSTGMNSH